MNFLIFFFSIKPISISIQKIFKRAFASANSFSKFLLFFRKVTEENKSPVVVDLFCIMQQLYIIYETILADMNYDIFNRWFTFFSLVIPLHL